MKVNMIAYLDVAFYVWRWGLLLSTSGRLLVGWGSICPCFSQFKVAHFKVRCGFKSSEKTHKYSWHNNGVFNLFVTVRIRKTSSFIITSIWIITCFIVNEVHYSATCFWDFIPEPSNWFSISPFQKNKW